MGNHILNIIMRVLLTLTCLIMLIFTVESYNTNRRGRSRGNSGYNNGNDWNSGSNGGYNSGSNDGSGNGGGWNSGSNNGNGGGWNSGSGSGLSSRLLLSRIQMCRD